MTDDARVREISTMNEQLKAIRELVEQTTPGEWEWANFRNEDGTPIKSKDEIKALLCKSVDKSVGEGLHLAGVTAKDENGDLVICYTGNGPRSHKNANFIAVAHQAIPYLFALLDAKDREIAALNDRNAVLEQKLEDREVVDSLTSPAPVCRHCGEPKEAHVGDTLACVSKMPTNWEPAPLDWEVRRQALEEAAKIVDAYAEQEQGAEVPFEQIIVAQKIARKIRALARRSGRGAE